VYMCLQCLPSVYTHTHTPTTTNKQTNKQTMDVTTVVFRTVLGVVTAYHIITLLLWILIITLYMQAQHFEWLSKGMENGALDELLRQLHTQVPFQPSSTVATDESPPPPSDSSSVPASTNGDDSETAPLLSNPPSPEATTMNTTSLANLCREVFIVVKNKGFNGPVQAVMNKLAQRLDVLVATEPPTATMTLLSVFGLLQLAHIFSVGVTFQLLHMSDQLTSFHLAWNYTHAFLTVSIAPAQLIRLNRLLSGYQFKNLAAFFSILTEGAYVRSGADMDQETQSIEMPEELPTTQEEKLTKATLVPASREDLSMLERQLEIYYDDEWRPLDKQSYIMNNCLVVPFQNLYIHWNTLWNTQTQPVSAMTAVPDAAWKSHLMTREIVYVRLLHTYLHFYVIAEVGKALA